MHHTASRALDAYRRHFGTEPTLVASAPGRINLIGEHTDYNGGFVLPCAIDFRVAAAIGEGPGQVYSADFDESQTLGGCADRSWADYPRGVAWALSERGFDPPAFHAAFSGDVPQGAGLSSSAAIECATALALDSLGNLGLDRRELARICQRAENGFVGVQSGIMDQYASLLCREGSALFIDCRSLDARSIPLPLRENGLVLLVCNTRVKRTLGATAYNERRAACERAARELGVAQLRDATLADLQKLSGEELARARHVVTEDARVLGAVEALERSDFAHFGQLMYQSHESLRDDFDVSIPELDTFVDCARQGGALGARLTGAGFGGCAIALIHEAGARELMNVVSERFARDGFQRPDFYLVHPSPGACIEPLDS